MDLLTSLHNPWIKELRKLDRASERRKARRFLCEGTHLLQEAIAAGWPIEAVCYTEAWSLKHGELLHSLSHGIRQQLVSTQVLKSLVMTETPDGVVTLAAHPPHPRLAKTITLAIALETVQEPGNLGVLVRAAAAVEADGIWMSPDSVDPTHPKVLRSSAGQWFRLPINTVELPRWIETCRQHSIQILAAAAGGQCYWDADLARPTVFLLGNEGSGLSQAIRRLADDTISIPMADGVESLNVGTTGALLLYEAKRQRCRS